MERMMAAPVDGKPQLSDLRDPDLESCVASHVKRSVRVRRCPGPKFHVKRAPQISLGASGMQSKAPAVSRLDRHTKGSPARPLLEGGVEAGAGYHPGARAGRRAPANPDARHPSAPGETRAERAVGPPTQRAGGGGPGWQARDQRPRARRPPHPLGPVGGRHPHIHRPLVHRPSTGLVWLLGPGGAESRRPKGSSEGRGGAVQPGLNARVTCLYARPLARFVALEWRWSRAR